MSNKKYCYDCGHEIDSGIAPEESRGFPNNEAGYFNNDGEYILHDKIVTNYRHNIAKGDNCKEPRLGPNQRGRAGLPVDTPVNNSKITVNVDVPRIKELSNFKEVIKKVEKDMMDQIRSSSPLIGLDKASPDKDKTGIYIQGGGYPKATTNMPWDTISGLNDEFENLRTGRFSPLLQWETTPTRQAETEPLLGERGPQLVVEKKSKYRKKTLIKNIKLDPYMEIEKATYQVLDQPLALENPEKGEVILYPAGTIVRMNANGKYEPLRENSPKPRKLEWNGRVINLQSGDRLHWDIKNDQGEVMDISDRLNQIIMDITASGATASEEDIRQAIKVITEDEMAKNTARWMNPLERAARREEKQAAREEQAKVRPNKVLTPVEKQEIITELLQGSSYTEISARHDMSLAQVHQVKRQMEEDRKRAEETERRIRRERQLEEQRLAKIRQEEEEARRLEEEEKQFHLQNSTNKKRKFRLE